MWIDIPGLYYKYQISDKAVIRREIGPNRYIYARGYVYAPKGQSYHTAKVKLVVAPKKYKVFRITTLMAEAFMGGRANHPGMVVIHKNGATLDNCLENLRWGKQAEVGKVYSGNRRVIEKIAPNGEVVEYFSSMQECAKKEHLSRKAVWARCTGKLHVDEFQLTGYTYRYER